MDKSDFINIKTKKVQTTQYSTYYSLDDMGNTILILKDIPPEKKIIIWQNSSLKNEMLIEFPNISTMSEFVNHRVVDNGEFKQKLISYMEYIQGKYLSGDITQDEFKEAIKNPDPSLPNF